MSEMAEMELGALRNSLRHLAAKLREEASSLSNDPPGYAQQLLIDYPELFGGTQTQWTSTPPQEPGWYWVAVAGGDPVVAEVADNGYAYMVGSPPEEHPRMLQAKGWLWWPVPLQPPSAP